MVGVKKVQQDCSQWCPVTGQEATGTSRSNRNFHYTSEKWFFCSKGDQTPGEVAQRGCGVPILGDTADPTHVLSNVL